MSRNVLRAGGELVSVEAVDGLGVVVRFVAVYLGS